MSPFVSKAQAKYLYAKHPEIASKFAKHTDNYKDLPEHIKDKKKKGKKRLLGK